MAWNRSDTGKTIEKSDIAQKSPSYLKGLLASVVVMGGAALAFFLLTNGNEKKIPQQQETPEPKKILPTAVPATNVVKKTVEAPKEQKLKPGERRHVEWKRPENWDQLTRAQKTRIQPVGRVIKPIGWDDRKLFTEMSDKKIERLMRIKPGELVLGTVKYDQRFVKQFLDSLKTPIEFTEEDTEADRAMKQAVIDTRADLKAAYDRGEDIAEIMNATEKEAHRLAAYKLNLRKEIVEYKKSGEHSDQDVKDYIDAANKILSDNGMEPLRMGKIWYHKAQYDAQVKPQAATQESAPPATEQKNNTEASK